MKNYFNSIIIFLTFIVGSMMNAQQCSVTNATIFHSGDNSSNRFRNNPELAGDNLLPYITVSDIAGGTYADSSGQTFCSTVMGNATLFKKTGVGTSFSSSVFYNYNIVTAANSPVIYASNFSAILPAFDGTLNNTTLATDRLSYYLRVSITDGTTGTETTIINSLLINQMGGVSSPVDYKMLPGRTYTVKYYAWKATNSCTDLYLDNPRLYLSPIPKTTGINPCASSLSGTVSAALAPYISSTTPTNLALRWLQGTTNVSGNTISTGTYTPYYFNSASNCYYPAGDPVTVGSGPQSVSVLPTTQTVNQNGSTTNLTVTSSNGTSFQWYSNSTNNNTTGTIIPGATQSSYTPPSNTIGTIYYYVVVSNSTCSTTSTTVQVTTNTCNAGNTPPVINNNTGS